MICRLYLSKAVTKKKKKRARRVPWANIKREP